MPPDRLLRADSLELPLLLEAVEHAAQYQHERDQNLARMIINEYANAMKRGR